MKQKTNMVMPRWSKILIGAGATALLLFGALPETNTNQVLADQPAVSVNWGTYEVNAPYLKPQWSFAVSNWNSSYSGMESKAALAEDGRVIAIDSKGQLIALDAATGKSLWVNGNSWRPMLTYNQGTVYGALNDGRVCAISGAGNLKWRTAVKVEGIQSIEPNGDTIYVTANMKLYAFNAATGALRWQTEEKGLEYSAGFGGLQLVDGVIIRTYIVQGALSSSQINAYDAKTGKQLWTRFKSQDPIAIRGGLLYSVQDSYNMGNYETTDDGQIRESLVMHAINARTGEVKGTRTYSWTSKFDPTQSVQVGINGAPILDGDKLYIFQGEKLAQYDFSQYKPNAAPVKTWGQYLKDVYPLYAVHGDRMLYRNYNTGALTAMKLANGQVIGWQVDNPVVQTDIYDNGLYVGQSDGVFHAYDYATTKPIFSVKASSRYFGPTLKTNDMIIVQSKGMLQAVKLPAAMK
ncbi:outer membrane protein assembly factor BamB [Paenibacillus cellulosilyticus]|uniref:Outer membrane protein assembly factor BamB n=1 Tax=Paenibacillus cellulosilyticus TaxID=375489 RepID=A0A2V2Z0P2_9BACL|nr:PQQ-binding-like beta-propeller repeat protein [Paenibacillus cellulosilyticus]PWW00740.1 outer membrane protein assembly factor BamB [Paenibacillus cellulosilyticus]QKS45596.1 PQQ-binding-like beta-propeller repeat protein [Paenibacillus cellulosilyticus]